MVLTEEENRKLTQVGPGTPGGELLRRYWHPVAPLSQLTDESPTKFVRILGEDLVLFRDKSGRVGLLADHCSHRGASLLYGRVEERGIACAYHGWLYDTMGNCLETPAEPADSNFHLTIKHRAYPVEKYIGLYWAYLGPAPVPPVRQLDLGTYPVERIAETNFDANWVQVVENNLDGTHLWILHQDTTGRPGTLRGTTRGMIDDMVSLDYTEMPFGIMRTMHYEANVEDDPLIFPTILRRAADLSIKIPVDDTHTRRFSVSVATERDRVEPQPIPFSVMPPDEAKSGPGIHPDVGHRMNMLTFQDIMVIETQGVITPRDTWRVATSDRGITMFDQILLREMDRVQAGLDPLGVSRDPNEIVDTKFEFYRTHRRYTPSTREARGYAQAGARG